MSEPESKLDLTSLNDALGEEGKEASSAEHKSESKKGDDGGYNIDGDDADDAAAKERADEMMRKSNTLNSGDEGALSSAKPEPTKSGSDAKGEDHDADLEKLDPTSRQIKAMFPDTDTDTIQAVVAAEGGDFERAINTLLQMSDPSYVPPPPMKESTQTRNDAELARVLAAEEEDHARRQQQMQQQQAQQNQSFFPPSVRGGGLGSLFGGGGRSNDQRPAQSPSYDPSNLTYQPRVRRTTSGTPTHQQPPHAQAPYRQGSSPSEAAPQVWPGPKEAKAWQEDINKMAETGFAKAASTFSALRQRGEQTLQGIQQNRAQAAGNAAAGSSGGPQGTSSGSFFGTWAGRKNSATSPNIGSGKGFDRDASPVGDNELAKILARGRNDRNSGSYDGTGHPPQRKNSASNAHLDRYKSAQTGSQLSQKQSIADEGDDDLGWDDAGRTGAGEKDDDDEKKFEPIKINDGTTSSSSEKQAGPPTRNAVSLMEKSTGRGISPSPRNKSSESKGSHDDASTGKGKQLAKGSADDDDDEHDDGNSDDLEYVANPFEDDD